MPDGEYPGHVYAAIRKEGDKLYIRFYRAEADESTWIRQSEISDEQAGLLALQDAGFEDLPISRGGFMVSPSPARIMSMIDDYYPVIERRGGITSAAPKNEKAILCAWDSGILWTVGTFSTVHPTLGATHAFSTRLYSPQHIAALGDRYFGENDPLVIFFGAGLLKFQGFGYWLSVDAAIQAAHRLVARLEEIYGDVFNLAIDQIVHQYAGIPAGERQVAAEGIEPADA
jgi:hypothetical protein